jgi:hypothetical protein
MAVHQFLAFRAASFCPSLASRRHFFNESAIIRLNSAGLPFRSADGRPDSFTAYLIHRSPTVDGPDQAQIICGRLPSDAFEFIMEREALQAFVEVASDALREMDSDAG